MASTLLARGGEHPGFASRRRAEADAKRSVRDMGNI
jgi:hypothetical protein